MTRKPKSPKRQAIDARYRRSGRQVSVVITDEMAQTNLATLEETHGGPKAAIEHALRRTKR